MLKLDISIYGYLNEKQCRWSAEGSKFQDALLDNFKDIEKLKLHNL
jgi:hypothetical protein